MRKEATSGDISSNEYGSLQIGRLSQLCGPVAFREKHVHAWWWKNSSRMQESINIESATIQWKWIVADRMALSTMWVAFREIYFYVWKYLCNNLPELQRSISIPPEKIQWIWIVADLTPKPLQAGWKQLMQLLQHNKMSLCVLNLLSKHPDILIYKIFLFVVYRYNSLKSCDPGWVQAGNWVGRCKWQLGHTSVAVTLTYTLIRYLAFSTNTFVNFNKYILRFGQINFAIGTHECGSDTHLHSY